MEFGALDSLILTKIVKDTFLLVCLWVNQLCLHMNHILHWMVPHFWLRHLLARNSQVPRIKHTWDFEKRDCELLTSFIHLSEAVGLSC